MGVNKYAQHDAHANGAGGGAGHELAVRRIDNTAALANQTERLQVCVCVSCSVCLVACFAGVLVAEHAAGECLRLITQLRQHSSAAPALPQPRAGPAPICTRPQRVRATRDQAAVDAVLARMQAAAHSGGQEPNLLELAIEAARLR